MDSWKPVIEVESDYDGYFAGMVNSWLEVMHQQCKVAKSQKIVVSAGPYRMSAVACDRVNNVLYIDFYAALRNGFGCLTGDEVQQIIDEWL